MNLDLALMTFNGAPSGTHSVRCSSLGLISTSSSLTKKIILLKYHHKTNIAVQSQ